MTLYYIKLLLSYLEKKFSQNKLYYYILLENKEFCGKWQNLNYERIKSMGLEDKIIPIHAEAHDLPFAHEFFDVAISVDAYHYFGVEKDYLTNYFAPLVKKGGQIAVAVPGLKKEFTNGVPAELLPYWFDDMNFHSCDW